MLPSQLIPERHGEAFSPALRLAVAVIENAFATLVVHASSRSRRGRALHAEAWSWFVSDEMTHPFAFRRICDNLGLEPERVRANAARFGPRDGG